MVNIEGVSSWKSNPKPRLQSTWEPPPSKTWKWNVDGSARGKPGPTGIGGVLRDEKGTILSKFAAGVGIRESNEAEFLAIVKALELSMGRDWLKHGNLIVESDSKVALSWAKSGCPWKLQFYGNKLRNLLLVLGNVSMIHKNRESNEIADNLAKDGSSLGGSWVKWFDDNHELCSLVSTGASPGV